MLSVRFLAALFGAFAPASAWTLRGVHPRAPIRATVSLQLRTVDDNLQLEALIGQTANSNAIVVVHFDDPGGQEDANPWDSNPWDTSSTVQDTFYSALVSRVADQYSSSSLYGGAPLICLQIDRDTGSVICSQRGVLSFPTTQIWSRGICTEVSAVELEEKLLSLGVASAAKPMKKGNLSNRVDRDVDDIVRSPGYTLARCNLPHAHVLRYTPKLCMAATHLITILFFNRRISQVEQVGAHWANGRTVAPRADSKISAMGAMREVPRSPEIGGINRVTTRIGLIICELLDAH